MGPIRDECGGLRQRRKLFQNQSNTLTQWHRLERRVAKLIIAGVTVLFTLSD